MNVTLKRIATSAILCFASCPSMPATAQNPNPSDTFDLSKVKIQIVDATFVTRMTSEKADFTESNPDKNHGLIVTLKIAKTPGEQLTLTCQDIVLHYRYGESSDIARCYGLSTYTTVQDQDRSMALYSQGWGKSTTGLTTTKSGTVYVDVFFQNMEPDTSDLYIFIAQPTGSHFKSTGWKKN